MRPLLLRLAWIVTDVIAFTGSSLLAYFFRVGFIFSSDIPVQHFLLASMVAAPAWIFVLFTTRTFVFTRKQASVRNFAYIAYAGMVGGAFQVIAYFFLFNALFSRLLLVEMIVVEIIATFAWHIVMEQVVRKTLRKNPPAYPTLVVGLTRESRKLIGRLQKQRSPLTPVGILDAQGVHDREVEGVPVLGKLNQLEASLEKLRVTHLIQCSDLEQSMNLLGACRARGITYVLLPSVLGIVEHDERVESLEGMAVTMVTPRRSLWQWFVE